MIKTSYQTPELRDANDNIIQQGAFGKNTALSNSTNDGWIDYVMNNLEALHDVVGETSPTLDANGHVVEPANLAIGDEDGNRIKDSYLKLSGGKVTGIASFRTDLRMLDNQDNRWGGLYVPGTTSSVQYLSLYGGTRATGDARLNLYNTGNGKFELTGYSTDGANAYTLTNDNSGNLNWRGYPLAWKKDYLPLAGGTMSGNITGDSTDWRLINGTANRNGSVGLFNGGVSQGASVLVFGANHASRPGWFDIRAVDANGTEKLFRGKPDGSLTWDGNAIALAKNVLPLSGGTMTGNIFLTNGRVNNVNSDGYIQILGANSVTNGSVLTLSGGDRSTDSGAFAIKALSGSNSKELKGLPNGTLTWDGKNVERVNAASTKINDSGYTRYENGLQICWGVLNLPDTGDGVSTSFPVAFSKTPTVTGSLVRTVSWRVWGVSTTSFYAQQVAAPNTNQLQWVAVGWWK